VETVLAAARLGADLVLLNTDFPGPQLRQALAHHDLTLAVHDAEFARAFDESGFAGPRVLAWHDADVRGETLDTIAAGPKTAPPTARRPGKIVILTSGTTGAPKGAPREPNAEALLGPLTTILTRIPIATGKPILIAPPLFHGFGIGYLGLALIVRAPIVLRRRFDATQLLAMIAEHRVRAALVVPVMLKRVLELPPEVRARYDTSSLRAVLSGGAPLAARLASDFMDAFGDIVFNLYGSSEVGFAAMANPADLRAAPGTVGYPQLGATVRILDEARREVRPGVVGSVFVGGPLAIDGYSGGGAKEKAAGLFNTGDLGHIGECGRLFIDGREDDMIVSGGENVFPKEVEELLLRHDAVADAAVLGVRDAEFGQRLRAFVVTRAGAHVTADDVAAYVRAHVARFKVPRDVVFVDELPRNATGKLDKRRLPAASD
jgi:acyl-CoA synthetase (AMP-forming)/AMP-acid ligase II